MEILLLGNACLKRRGARKLWTLFAWDLSQQRIATAASDGYPDLDRLDWTIVQRRAVALNVSKHHWRKAVRVEESRITTEASSGPEMRC
ncbi:hypothetical protein A20C1_11131 [marine actinobacterium PHSC20C1]|nr:hypothetical protein A20C1_11131 [marine actinobacterium PHSC20C1]